MEEIEFPFKINELRTGKGLNVIAIKSKSKVNYVSLTAFSGSNSDPICKNGLSNLTLLSLIEGTKNFNHSELQKILLKSGIIVETYPFYDRSTILFKSVEENIPYLLKLLFEIFFYPSFPEGRIEKLKKNIIGEIIEREELPQEVGYNTLKRLVFRTTPYQFPAIGTVGTIRNINLNDIKNFHKNHYVPSNALLLIASNCKFNDFINELDEITPNKTTPQNKKKYKKVKETLPFYEIVPFDTTQSHIFIGRKGIKRNSKDFYPLLLLEILMGSEENYSNLLQQEIRENLGLCYDTFSSFTEESTKREGIIYFYGGVSQKNEELFMENIFKIVKKLKQKKIGKRKIKQSKEFLIHNFYSKFQDTESFINYILNLKTYGMENNHFYKFKKIISSLKEKDLKYILEKYFEIEKFSTVIVKKL